MTHTTDQCSCTPSDGDVTPNDDTVPVVPATTDDDYVPTPKNADEATE